MAQVSGQSWGQTARTVLVTLALTGIVPPSWIVEICWEPVNAATPGVPRNFTRNHERSSAHIRSPLYRPSVRHDHASGRRQGQSPEGRRHDEGRADWRPAFP